MLLRWFCAPAKLHRMGERVGAEWRKWRTTKLGWLSNAWRTRRRNRYCSRITIHKHFKVQIHLLVMHELETGWLDWMDEWMADGFKCRTCSLSSLSYWFSVLGFTQNLCRLTRQTLIPNNVRVHDREKLSHTIHELENFSTRHIAHTKWKSINYDMTTAMTCPIPITFTYLIVGWTPANARQSHANEHQKFFVSHTIYSHCLHLWAAAENENAEKRVFVSSFEIIIIFHLGEFSFSPPNYMCFVRSKSCSPAKLEKKSFLPT